ncbi:MAG: nucleotidyltransferase domain-containing protein [Gemmatimonadales bacterium]
MTRSVAASLAQFMLRTARTPLGAVWGLAYRSLVRAAIGHLRGKHREASIYLKGSFASGEEIYGISDVDLVVVLPATGARPGSAQLSAHERWKRLCQRVPVFRLVIEHCWFYEEDDFRESLSAPCLTYGLASSNHVIDDDRAAFLGPHSLRDHSSLQIRPSLYGVRNEWRNVRGRNRLPTATSVDAQDRRVAAWLDLQYWWRHAFLACADPEWNHVPLLCVKLLAEPVRLWLWLARGEMVATREGALRRGLSEMPEEREAFQLGLDLLSALPHSPRPPMSEVIAALLRQTERLALHMSEATSGAGWIDVKLTGSDELTVSDAVLDRMHALTVGGKRCDLVPLADWRARAVPGLADEAILLVHSDSVDPDFIGTMAQADGAMANPAFRYNSMLLMPTTNPERGILRAVQCELTDPVSLALAGGNVVARFPELRGWSASHCARRAVAEHRAWLSAKAYVFPPHGWIGVQSSSSDPKTGTVGLLFSAARAALFLESIEEDRAELAVTVAGVAACLVERDGSCRDVVETVLHNYRAFRGVDKISYPVAPLLAVVRALPAYSDSRCSPRR